MMAPLLLGSLLLGAPPELGKISWLRDFEEGLDRSKESGKPVLLLFDEVPGCQTVLSYGENVLSHPVIVSAAHAAFIPVAVYNNTGGVDREVLTAFGEPAWNNPVVRILDHQKRPLAPRVAGDYTAIGLAKAMITALRAAKQKVPDDLLRLSGLAARTREKATFSMYCFWECEARLGRIEGVVAAEVGFLHGEEVVEVEFDPQVIDRARLIELATKESCARTVYTRSDSEHEIALRVAGSRAYRTNEALRRSPRDAKYYLARSSWREVPMSETQALRVNAALRFGDDPSKFVPR
jgi:hypothetical protein